MIQYQKMPRYPPKWGKNNSGSVGKPGNSLQPYAHSNLA
jgi:hypothetical protein